MKIEICDNLEDWNRGLKQLSKLEFIQSWEWGDFQASIGNKTVRFLLEGRSVQGFEQNIGLGRKFLYLPRTDMTNLDWGDLLGYLKKEYVFLRVESLGVIPELRTMDYELVKNRQPRQTLILSLNKTEEEILLEMHPKTRYNIHLAERKGIIIKEEKNADIFWRLNLDTTGRDGFRSHNKRYYEKMLEQKNVYQLIAYHNNEPIASNILISNDQVMTYLHGASANKFRNLMAPYLLQWQGILLGKKLGCNFYDFWGIAPSAKDNQKEQISNFNGFSWPVNHPWSGVTRFKVGFGGEYREYSEAVEIPLHDWQYKIFNFLKKFKK